MKMKSIKELEKGCEKEFVYIDSPLLKDVRSCGRMEDLKHSEHIIYCIKCKSQLSILKDILKLIADLKRDYGNRFVLSKLESKITEGKDAKS